MPPPDDMALLIGKRLDKKKGPADDGAAPPMGGDYGGEGDDGGMDKESVENSAISDFMAAKDPQSAKEALKQFLAACYPQLADDAKEEEAELPPEG